MMGYLAIFFSVLASMLSSFLGTLAKWFLVKSAMSMELRVVIEASRSSLTTTACPVKNKLRWSFLNIEDLQNIDAVVSLANVL